MLGLTILQIIAIVFGFGLLVLVHELGHFMAAKFFKVKVVRFKIGFGREIVGFTKNETRYALGWIPLGGMCEMPGEDVNTAAGTGDEFLSQAWYKRLMIAFFGPFMNYVFAAILFAIVIYFWGIAKPSYEPVIGSLFPDKPAELAGLKSNDKIVAINGVKIDKWDEMSDLIQKNSDKKIRFDIMRDNKPMSFMIMPKYDSVTGRGMIGITPGYTTEKVGLANSAWFGVKMCIIQSVFTVRYLAEKIIKWEKPEVSGPIGVAQILASAVKSGIEQVIHLIAIISVALALFNLFPIPIVDGGHIMFALVELVTRKPVNKKVLQVANVAGLSLIGVIFLFATYNDLLRLGWLNFMKYFK
jgi:regulator of sigma E protease